MKQPKVVVGQLTGDQLFVKSISTSKKLSWLKSLEGEEVVEFFAELLKLVTQISQGTKDGRALSVFLSEWRETALINEEPDVLDDIIEAERELDAGGGKDWSLIKEKF